MKVRPSGLLCAHRLSQDALQECWERSCKLKPRASPQLHTECGSECKGRNQIEIESRWKSVGGVMYRQPSALAVSQHKGEWYPRVLTEVVVVREAAASSMDAHGTSLVFNSSSDAPAF